MSKNIPVQIIENIMDACELDSDNIQHKYSGRSMYGENCFGIVFQGVNNAFQFFTELGAYAYEVDRDDLVSYTLQSDLERLAQVACMDSMGMDVIVYFPGYILAKKDNDD